MSQAYASPASRAALSQAVPFFQVADLKASLRFYVDDLGFEMRNWWPVDGEPRWCWVQRDAVAVMLQQFTDAAVARPPPASPGTGVTVCIMCGDALTVWREAAAAGLPVERPVVGNGLWVVSLRDPDGYRLDFESPTDAPEESVYAGD
ncbi:VOC family protein [Phenylobacterium sp.]|uniref:VOC family protein n=1 Tax=Phenylobacterium sp. TaxID=1871053 RepID=UPI0035B11A2B